MRNLCWFIIYKHIFVCLSLSFIRDIKKNIYICMEAHYLTKRFSLTDRPCVQIRSFSAMSIHSILLRQRHRPSLFWIFFREIWGDDRCRGCSLRIEILYDASMSCRKGTKIMKYSWIEKDSWRSNKWIQLKEKYSWSEGAIRFYDTIWYHWSVNSP